MTSEDVIKRIAAFDTRRMHRSTGPCDNPDCDCRDLQRIIEDARSLTKPKQLAKRLDEYVPTPKQDPATVNYHAMMGEKVVFHFAKDVDLVAWIERVYHPELVNLYVLSDGYLDVGAGAGNACSHTCVMLSPGVGGWSWPPVEP